MTTSQSLSEELGITKEEANYLLLASSYGYSPARVAKWLKCDEPTAKARLERAEALLMNRRSSCTTL